MNSSSRDCVIVCGSKIGKMALWFDCKQYEIMVIEISSKFNLQRHFVAHNLCPVSMMKLGQPPADKLPLC